MTESEWFDRVPVPLLEADLSVLYGRIKPLRDGGVKDFLDYAAHHPDFTLETVRSIAVVNVNVATIALFEAERKEQLLGSLDSMLDAGASHSSETLVLAVAEGKKEVRIEWAAKTIRGRKFSLSAHFSLPAQDDPHPHVLVSVLDATVQEDTGKEMHRLEKSIEFILGATKTGLDIIDARFQLRYVDPEWQKVYGDPSGRKCFEYFMGSEAPCPGCGLKKPFETRAISVSEEILAREGNRPVQVTSVPFQDESGEWLVAEVNVDISERKRMEENNLRLAALVDYADDAIVGLDMDRRITVWNRGAERIYGYTAAEMIGQLSSRVIPTDREEEARTIRDRIARGEIIEHFDTVRRRKDGVLIDVSLTLSAIRDAGGNVVGMASTARDITGKRRMEARINRARRLESLAVLAGGIAHQFNNINTVVKGYIDLLQRDGNLKEGHAVFAQAAARGIQRAIIITDRLLALTDTTSAGLDLVRLEDVARSQWARLEARGTAEKAACSLDLGESAPVRIEGKRLETAVSALFENALDALSGRPVRSIAIRSGNLDGEAFLEVSDTGCGIPAGDMDRLFTPFYTAKGEWAPSGSPQEKLRGVGLSLAIAHATISDFGGRIEVESSPGIGSTFRIRLPAAVQE